MVAVVLGWALLYLPGLGTRELQGEEARRVLPGRTMLQTGDWAVPRSAGRIYNRKPPLVNWCAAACIRVTGVMNEWSARLPSALAMFALGMGVLLAGRVWLGNEAALLWACGCLTNIGFLEKGRLIEIEALYCALTGLALAWWLGCWWKHREWTAWCGAGVLLGLGFLAKGPLHVWYFYALVVGVLVAEGCAGRLLSRAHLAGLACFSLVWAPWAALNSGANPQKDSGKVWMEQLTHRLGFAEFDAVNWLLQVPQSLANLLPWVLLLGAWKVWRKEAREDSKRLRGWMTGLAAGLAVAFFSIALLPSSRPRFMLPLNTVALLLLVLGYCQLPPASRERWLRRGLAALMTVAALAGAAALGAAWWWRAEGLVAGWQAAAGFVVLLAGLLGAGWLRGDAGALSQPARLALGTLAVSGSLVALLGVTAAPLSTLRDDLRPFARELLAVTGPDPDVVLYKLEERMWPFYLGMGCREVASLEELPERVRWVMVRERDAEMRRGEMSRRFGPILGEHVIEEPLTNHAGGKGSRYLLMEFQSTSAPP
jgi:4-amino-4-deoxy-L-arabinose transferase-like glycosyltransferase